MNHHENLKIIALVGLSGSGKTTAVEYFTNKDTPKVYFGGFAYEMMAERGIEQGEENEKKFRVKIRETEGPDIYAQRAIQQVRKLLEAGQHRIILDGMYTMPEYKALKHEFPGEMSVVAIVAPKHKRYRWLSSRADRPQTPEISMERDRNEIEDIQKGGPIAAADFFVLNDGSVEDFHKQLDLITQEINF